MSNDVRMKVLAVFVFRVAHDTDGKGDAALLGFIMRHDFVVYRPACRPNCFPMRRSVLLAILSALCREFHLPPSTNRIR